MKQGDRNAGEGTDWKPRNKEEKEERQAVIESEVN